MVALPDGVGVVGDEVLVEGNLSDVHKLATVDPFIGGAGRADLGSGAHLRAGGKFALQEIVVASLTRSTKPL